MPRVLAPVLLALTLVLSGCVSTSPSPDPTPSSTPTAEEEPLFQSEEEALAAAEAAYAEYLAVSDAILMQGGREPDRISAVASGDALELANQGFERFRTEDLRSTATTSLTAFALADWSSGSITGYGCVDVSAVDVVNSLGQSVVADDRPPLQAFTVVIKVSEGVLKVDRADAREVAGVCE